MALPLGLETTPDPFEVDRTGVPWTSVACTGCGITGSTEVPSIKQKSILVAYIYIARWNRNIYYIPSETCWSVGGCGGGTPVGVFNG